MARGAWQQTTAQIAWFVWGHGKKGKLMNPAVFNPYEEETGTGRIKITSEIFGQFAARMGARPAKPAKPAKGKI